jgi:archaellum component FlaC
MTSLNSATGEERTNPQRGSSFDDFLRDEGIFEATHEKASERARNEQIEDTLQRDERVGNKLPTLPG